MRFACSLLSLDLELVVRVDRRLDFAEFTDERRLISIQVRVTLRHFHGNHSDATFGRVGHVVEACQLTWIASPLRAPVEDDLDVTPVLSGNARTQHVHRFYDRFFRFEGLQDRGDGPLNSTRRRFDAFEGVLASARPTDDVAEGI